MTITNEIPIVFFDKNCYFLRGFFELHKCFLNVLLINRALRHQHNDALGVPHSHVSKSRVLKWINHKAIVVESLPPERLLL